MLANFIESNPGPVKAAMAAMGLLEDAYRLPIVGPKPESREKIVKALNDLGLMASPKKAYA
jgi:4-hydroxy-tetrahydrodipicolinate synthase